MALDTDIITEMKVPEKFDLGAFVSSKVQFPTKDVKIILDIEGSMRAYELADQIADLELDKKQIEEDSKGGITGGDTESVESEIAARTLELSNLVDELNSSALTFTLRGIAPKVWRVIDKTARQKFPTPKTGTDDEKREVTIAQSAWVDVETVKSCIVSITAPDGGVQEGKEVTHEIVANLFGVLAQSEWNKLVETTNAITYQVGAFDSIIGADADFLPASSASDTTETT